MYVHEKLAIFRTAYLSNKLLFAEHRSGELGIIGFSLEWLAGVSPKSRSGFSRRYERVFGITEEGWFIGGRWLKRGNFVRRASYPFEPFGRRSRLGREGGECWCTILGGSYRSVAVGAIMARIITRIIRTRRWEVLRIAGARAIAS